jgi:hypothetical protein
MVYSLLVSSAYSCPLSGLKVLIDISKNRLMRSVVMINGATAILKGHNHKKSIQPFDVI